MLMTERGVGGTQCDYLKGCSRSILKGSDKKGGTEISHASAKTSTQ
jgi:hypothetical protein